MAWPAAALVAVFWLRKPVSNALEKRLRRAKFGSAEFEFDPHTAEVLRAAVEDERAELEQTAPTPPETEQLQASIPDNAAKLGELAELSPAGAFLNSFIQLESTLRRLLVDRDAQSVAGPLQIGRAALRSGLFSDADHRAYEYLRAARNAVVHGSGQELTPAQAVELASLADTLGTSTLTRAFIQMRETLNKKE